MSAPERKLFKDVGLTCRAHNTWANKIHDTQATKHGVYAVVLEESRKTPDISFLQLQDWIRTAPRLGINNVRPKNAVSSDVFHKQIRDHLKTFWLPDETILYIGMTKDDSIKNRVADFYNHRLGRSSPHSGGQWVKTLSDWRELTIYWAATDSGPEAARKEKEMLQEFKLYSGGKIPFANLVDENGGRKQRDIKLTGAYS